MLAESSLLSKENLLFVNKNNSFLKLMKNTLIVNLLLCVTVTLYIKTYTFRTGRCRRNDESQG